MAVAEKTTFRSEGHIAVRVAGDSLSRFSGCSGATGDKSRPVFAFLDTAQYLFEGTTINFPIDIIAQSKHGVFRDCVVDGLNVLVAKSGTPYFIGCTFNKTSLVCKEKCGVRLIRGKFHGRSSRVSSSSARRPSKATRASSATSPRPPQPSHTKAPR